MPFEGVERQHFSDEFNSPITVVTYFNTYANQWWFRVLLKASGCQ